MIYFSIPELTASDTAKAAGINNSPEVEHIANLTNLVNDILDPLREAWGGPIHITSGYRCKALNIKVGGSKTSDHLSGLAVDVTTSLNDNKKRRDNNRKLIKLISQLGLPIDQVIGEYDYKVVHIGYRYDAGRKQYLFTNDLKNYKRINPEKL